MSKVKVSDSVSQWQGHLLSCCGQLKSNEILCGLFVIWSRLSELKLKLGFTNWWSNMCHLPLTCLLSWAIVSWAGKQLFTQQDISCLWLLITDHWSEVRGQIITWLEAKISTRWIILPTGSQCLISWQSLRWLIGSIMKRVTPSGLRTQASLWSWAAPCCTALAPWCTAGQWSHLLLFAPSSFLPLSHHLTSQPSH